MPRVAIWSGLIVCTLCCTMSSARRSTLKSSASPHRDDGTDTALTILAEAIADDIWREIAVPRTEVTDLPSGRNGTNGHKKIRNRH